MAKCRTCGAADCWDESDTAWLSTESGWFGDIDGCPTSIFFIHGKQIREQRHVPEHRGSVQEFIGKIQRWSVGLDNPRFIYTHDTGGGDCGLWIEGTREPRVDDMKRLHEARARIRERALQELEWRQRQIASIDALQEPR